MTQPKQLPNEHLSDLAVSMTTKLQGFRASIVLDNYTWLLLIYFIVSLGCYGLLMVGIGLMQFPTCPHEAHLLQQNLGKYFKQSAKALEERIARDTRFYGALIRLQQNWKIKRPRLMAAASGNEGFYLDLFDNSLYDSAALFRPSALSTIPVEHDKAGMLVVNLPRKSCHILQFDLLGYSTTYNSRKSSMTQAKGVNEVSKELEREHGSDDERVREIHSTLHEVHRSIHDEQLSTFWYLIW